jgi:A/G-specific adenine glycosylase
VDDVALAVVQHYAKVRRDLPWRRTRDPYAIWVSEVMLQQTRVQTVIPYWERWMTKFPTLRALADAPLDDVLAAWAGLGYYSRARNLHRGAQAVRETGLPSRASELRGVPGIGPYTAGAIASIAFGEKAPLVDGNVARVLARVFAIAYDIKTTAGTRALWQRAGELMAALPEPHAPGALNQGLMELGATICSPTGPRCLVCPLSKYCRAAIEGRQDELPVVAKRKAIDELPVIARAALWLQRGDQIVLARRRAEGLFGGLWELPQGDDRLDVARALGVTSDSDAVAYHDQVLSHRRLRIAVFRGAMPARLVEGALSGYDRISRFPLGEVGSLGIAAATTAILSKYEATPWNPISKRSSSSPKATRRSSKGSAASATTSKTPTSRRRRSARRRGSTS